MRLSPFYPHGGIPVPFSPGYTATCVEAIWQGLKVFEHQDIDTSLFRNDTMRGLKRTVRKYGKPLGHRKGVDGRELLGYLEARRLIYIPTYQWVLENKVKHIIDRLRETSKSKTIVLLDYDTNADVDKPPFLISDKDPLREEGFHTGGFSVGDGSVLFVASDALAHYVMMMYELERKEEYGDELAEAVSAKTKNSNFVLAAQDVSFSFDAVLDRLLDQSKDYRVKLRKLEKDGLLGHDDYSIAVNARPGGSMT